MSILACLIGILTLMISVALMAKEMEREGQTEEERDRAIENRDLRQEILTLEEEQQTLDEKNDKESRAVAERIKRQDRMIVIRKRLAELEKAQDPTKTDAELQKIAENLKLEIAALKDERPTLFTRVEELKKELAKRKVQPKPQESVVVRPGGVGSRTARNIFFVECNSTGITIMEEGKADRKISHAAITKNDGYNKFLQRVRNTRDSMVLFLVRKAGHQSYLWAAGWAESKFEVTTGKLPIPNDGKIDLSLFDR